uniref:Cyclin-dependent kinases regulatory subunit n=1 Tax=Leptobrachium leishanense TaxID=445787 RepID=A0A8C5LKV2_9ANUR
MRSMSTALWARQTVFEYMCCWLLHGLVNSHLPLQTFKARKGDPAKSRNSMRHVMLPKDLARQVPKTHLMSEEEWRRLGVQQSLGWVHYMIHEPEPHVLLFRRPLPKDQQK